MNYIDAKFEKIKKYENDAGVIVPVRKTAAAAGYDFFAAETTIIPSLYGRLTEWTNEVDSTQAIPSDYFWGANGKVLSLDRIAYESKAHFSRPTLVPTGIKCKIPEGYYLQLSARSSLPLKYMLVVANGIGVIDGDYYNNESNEGHIFFQLINLSPFDVVIQKGECFGQGMLMPYAVCEGDKTDTERTGGFGSTDKAETKTTKSAK